MTGTELNTLRKSHKLTQEALADIIGYTARQIRAWEKGAVVIPASACRSLARVLG